MLYNVYVCVVHLRKKIWKNANKKINLFYLHYNEITVNKEKKFKKSKVIKIF